MTFKKSLKIQSIVDQFSSAIDHTIGDLEVELLHYSEPNSELEQSFAFINHPKYLGTAEESNLVCVVAPLKLKDSVEQLNSKKTWLFSKNPELLAREIKKAFVQDTPYRASHNNIHKTAIVDPSVEIADDVVVGPFAVVEKNCRIGAGSFIGSHAVIEADVVIKENVTIHPHAYIGHSCEIGNDCEVMPQAIVGSEGFGYSHDHLGNHYRIPHTGRVILEDDVHIGAGTAIDRGTINDSVIGKGTKIDNQCHLAHNSVVGKNGLLTAQLVTAGSTTIGDNFVCGGKTAVAGHIKITDNVNVAALSGIPKSVDKPGAYGGYPLIPLKDALRVKASSVHIPELRKQVAKLLRKVFPEDYE